MCFLCINIYKHLINDQTDQQHDKHQEDSTSRRKATPHEVVLQDSPKTPTKDKCSHFDLVEKSFHLFIYT